MKIRDIAIDGFGVWHGVQITQLHDGLNVFYGPNEAGKTTLMQFVRTMLYGFSPDRRARYLPPVHGGRPGGELTLTTTDGLFHVRRHAAPDAAHADRLEIAAAGDVIRDDRLLGRLLGNVDEAVYRNVFAIGLREIQELGALSDTEAAQWLYSLTTGADRVSLVEVLGELGKARDRLLSATESSATIPQLLAERDKLRREARERTAVRSYFALGRQQRELTAKIDSCEVDILATERAARRIEIAAAVHEKWHARLGVDKELAIARSVPRLEQQALAEFDALLAKIELWKRRQRVTARRIAKNRETVETLGLNDAIVRRRTRIEAILEQEQWITALDAERVALKATVDAREQKRAELCARWGLDPKSSSAMPTASTSKAWRQLRTLATALAEARDRVKELSSAVDGRQEGVQAADRELAAALKARGADSLTPLLERAGQAVSQLRRRVQLDDRLTELQRRQEDLESHSQELLENTLLPGWSVVSLGIVFVLGVVGLLGGTFLPASFVGGARWWLAAPGLLISVGSAATKFLLEKTAALRSQTCLAQLDTLATQIEDATAERGKLDAELPRGGGPLLARLQAAEKEQAAIEALMPLESKRLAASKDVDAAEQTREQAHEEYTQLRHRWRHALIDAGLSPKTPPRRAGQLARVQRHLLKFDERLDAEREELKRREATVSAFVNRLAQLRAELDMLPEEEAEKKSAPVQPLSAPKPPVPVSTARLIDELRLLRTQLHEQAALATRRRSLIRQSRRLQERRKLAKAQARRHLRKLDTLLEEQGAVDVAELRRRAQESLRSDQLANQLDALSVEIRALLGPQVDEADIAHLVLSHTRADLDQQWLDQTARVQQLREQVKAALEQRGRARQEAETLVADRRGGQVRLRLGAIEQQLRDAAARWQVLAAAGWFLSGVRQRYERERQPETLREASGYFERLTEGRYRRIWTPLDRHELRVDDAEGHSLPVDVLSRGTREQVFLSLRLALVRWYARRGVDLPLVLDDVLVNYDAGRARAGAVVLREFASRGHQVLVFTCHEHMYQLFRSLDVSTRILPTNASAAAFPRVVVEEPPPVPVVVMEPSPPPEPVVLPPVEFEIYEPPAPLTNGHVIEEEEEETLPPPVPVEPPRKVRARSHVKFDCVHGPRGPFATALWHERVTFEVSAEAEPDRDEDDVQDDDWIEIDPVD